jgi:signal transduction histidine kinase
MKQNFLDKKMNEIKDMVLNRILIVVMFVMVLGISISLSRISQTGFIFNYAVQIFLALVIISLYVFRRKLSTIAKGIIFLCTLYTLALSGLLSFGLYGFGYAYFIPAAAIAFVYFDRRTGWIISVLSLIGILFIAFLFNMGVLGFSPSKSGYMESLPMWLNMIITVCLIAILITMFWSNLFSLLTNTFTHISNQQEDLQKMNDQLIIARDKAQESDKLKSSFLAHISHEIRTPLNIIIGFTDMLSQTDDAEQREELNQVVRQHSNVMLKMVNDIVDFSKLETNSLSIFNTQFNIQEVITEVERNVMWQKGEHVSCSISKCNLLVTADRDRLYQIIFNLLENALKFTHSGTVTFECKQEGSTLILIVSDTGIGIPADEQEKIFERFYKIDKFTQGAGLGLSLSRSMAKAMGGDIKVSSELGAGSVFECRISC